MQFICYPKCTTCQKARKWLEAKGIAIEERHIKENNPTTEETECMAEGKRSAAEEILQHKRPFIQGHEA